jgi:cation diffusion facilitator CzcD-associated flavoprotein CzcO
VISAIGPFVDPKPAQIPGIDDFEGKLIHSARWDHDYDLGGKRVAIVGTGASSVQIVPSIARDVGRLDVYQRTPIWTSPKFDPKIPEWMKGCSAASLHERSPGRGRAGSSYHRLHDGQLRRFPWMVGGGRQPPVPGGRVRAPDPPQAH